MDYYYFFFCIAFHSERDSMFKIILIFNNSNENEVTYLFLSHKKGDQDITKYVLA